MLIVFSDRVYDMTLSEVIGKEVMGINSYENIEEAKYISELLDDLGHYDKDFIYEFDCEDDWGDDWED